MIDTTHEKFASLLQQLSSSSKENFMVLFKSFLMHTEKHFQMEDDLMIEYGDPSISEHQAEHKRILNELKQFNQRVASGRTNFARAYIRNGN